MNRRQFIGSTTAALGFAGCQSGRDSSGATAAPITRPTRGPLRVHPLNGRYFADRDGRAVYLAGAHTWPNLVDQGITDPPVRFDFEGYLAFLRRHRHNFIRLWTWESTRCDIDEGGRRMRYYAAPQPWARTGPGEANDGKPKFDLTRFDPEYFDRLRSRVAGAGRNGIYVSVMLFEGWAMQHAREAYEHHPFHPANNVNGVQGDISGDGRGLEIHTLTNPRTLAIQETYVRRVVETVNPLDNVLYEISNENHPPSTDWQYHLIRFVHDTERRLRQRHPVGMTFQYKGGTNRTLFDSPADWVSPNPDGGYRDDPPTADGRKVVLNDTDHLWGIGGSADWVWKSFLRGYNPLFMDPYDGVTFGAGDPRRWEPIRRALGQTRAWAERLDLAQMIPRPELASTGYCLAKEALKRGALLVYLPKPGSVRLELTEFGRLRGEWFDLALDAVLPGTFPVPGGEPIELTSPVNGPSVLHLVG